MKRVLNLMCWAFVFVQLMTPGESPSWFRRAIAAAVLFWLLYWLDVTHRCALPLDWTERLPKTAPPCMDNGHPKLAVFCALDRGHEGDHVFAGVSWPRL